MAAKREVPKPPTGRGASRTDSALLPALDPEDPNAPEHRQFPRAKLVVPFQVWIGEGKDRRFSASLRSSNLSVSGVFLQSTFFLPVGTELHVSFQLEDGGSPVHARGEIIRQQHAPQGADDTKSGLGMRFVEFFDQTEVTLARLFLGPTLQRFAENYLSSERAQSLDSELDRVVDALAAWELQKVTTPADPWRGRSGALADVESTTSRRGRN